MSGDQVVRKYYVECRTFNPMLVGSNPTRPTIFLNLRLIGSELTRCSRPNCATDGVMVVGDRGGRRELPTAALGKGVKVIQGGYVDAARSRSPDIPPVCQQAAYDAPLPGYGIRTPGE